MACPHQSAGLPLPHPPPPGMEWRDGPGEDFTEKVELVSYAWKDFLEAERIPGRGHTLSNGLEV